MFERKTALGRKGNWSGLLWMWRLHGNVLTLKFDFISSVFPSWKSELAFLDVGDRRPGVGGAGQVSPLSLSSRTLTGETRVTLGTSSSGFVPRVHESREA